MLLLALSGLGCSSAPTTLPGASSSPAPVFEASPTGWASVADLGVEGTTGGEGAEEVTVSTLADFKAYAGDERPLTLYLDGIIGDGSRVTIASNHTVIGLPGAEFHGGLRVDGGYNVIVRNLKLVGNNCADVPVGAAGEVDCSAGADAFSIGDSAHHIWIDHCDISDGSDGNLDINDGADYVTVSWSKFSYSGSRNGGHQFSNLVGSSDNATGDAGHLRVTWHHNWWADNIHERMPRVRFGAVHIFNNFYSAAGNGYCIGLGYYANVLTEANVFFNVKDPIESHGYSNADSILVSRDNLFIATSGAADDKPGNVFTPPYAYTADLPQNVQLAVSTGAGTCAAPHVFNAGAVPTCTDS